MGIKLMMIRTIVSSFCVFVASVSLGQSTTEIKASASFENTRLETVIKEMERLFNQEFVYSSSSVPIEQTITLQLKDVTFLEALKELCNKLPLSYRTVNGKTVLRYIELKQTIRGIVLDRASQQPIIGGTVVVLGVTPLLGSTTDVEGKFKIENVPVGRRDIKLTYMGYEDYFLPGVLLGSGKELVLTIEMVESVTKLQELTIVGEGSSFLPENEMGIVSGRSFTVEETKRFAASGGDPLRLASAFAGVVTSSDDSNEIIVRGNTPRGIVWRLDGVEIPNPNHFSSEGTSSGGISMFSTQVISRSDFFTSAFAPEYGNATAGVFDIHLRNGNNEKPEQTLQLGFLGVDISAEGPFSKGRNSSYLFNYRYSTLGILDKMGLEILGDGETNSFQDLSLKLNFPTKSWGTFSVFGLGGSSSAKQTLATSYNNEQYTMGVVGLTHKFSLSTTAFLRSTISVSNSLVQDDNVQRYNGSEISAYENYERSFLRASVIFNKKINAHHLLEMGTIVSKIGFDYSRVFANPLSDPPINNLETLGDEGSSGTQQAYTTWKFRISNQLSLVSGLHLLRFDLTNEFSVEPRSAIKWQFNPRSSFSIGYGLHSRMESLEYYLGKYVNEDLSQVSYNRNLKFTKAHHFVLGFDRQISDEVYFKTEVYYQGLFNIPVAEQSSFPFSTINVTEGYTPVPLVNKGTGTNYGWEVTFERRFAGSFYYLFNTSVYESFYKATDGIKRNSRFNGNFSFNGLAGKEFQVGFNGKKNIIGINTKLSYAGNKRYTPIDLAASQQANAEIRSSTLIYEKRYPDHFRMDLQISYRKNKNAHTSEWRLDIQNVTNRGNVLTDYYQQGAVKQEIGFKLIPVLSYRLEF
jgi:hypothetical protein